MGSTEKFCLRWNDFESNISGAFRELREDKDFFDITLACDDDQVEAHKVILSACSPFFRTVLKRNKHQHPLVYLKGVRYTDLLSVLNFMYHGEVNVAQEELNSFLAVAEDLKVKGLTQNGSSSKPSNEQTTPRKPPITQTVPAAKRSYQQQQQQQQQQQPSVATASYQHRTYQADDDIQEVMPVIKSEPPSLPPPPPPPPSTHQHYPAPVAASIDNTADTHALAATEDYVDYEGYDDNTSYDDSMQIHGDDANKELDELINQMIVRCEESMRGPVWKCSVCKKENKDKAQIKRHVEKHISGFTHSCYTCSKEFKSRESLRIHSYTHRRQ